MLFEREAGRIRGSSGGALRIEHVGSTSVPRLAAKPVIDILLVVANPADEDAYLPTLQVRLPAASHPRAELVRASHVQGAGRGY
jgi:GrpB-like predicted nucleotidyltransferase (UPF0157 family)